MIGFEEPAAIREPRVKKPATIAKNPEEPVANLKADT